MLLEVDNLRTYFRVGRTFLQHAVHAKRFFQLIADAV